MLDHRFLLSKFPLVEMKTSNISQNIVGDTDTSAYVQVVYTHKAPLLEL